MGLGDVMIVGLDGVVEVGVFCSDPGDHIEHQAVDGAGKILDSFTSTSNFFQGNGPC
jgi:hypothetical protein